MLTGLAVWIAGNETAMVVAAFLGGAISVYMLWDWLFRDGPTRFSTLMAMAMLLGYGLGTVNTWLTLPRGGLTIAQFLGGDEASYTRGMAAVLIACAPLCLLGELFERPLFGTEFRLPVDYRTYVFVFTGTAAVMAGFLNHAIGFMGAQVEAGQLSVAAALLSWMFPPLTSLTIAVFLMSRGRVLKPLMGVCTVILCVLIMAIGRRNMIYSAMLVVFALRLTGFRLKGTLMKKILLTAGLGFFVAVGVSAFMLLRIAGFHAHASNASLLQRIEISLNWIKDGTALNRATEANQANVESRTFVLGFFADVLEGSSRRTPALGRDLAGYISQAIPRVFNPNKDLTFGEESLADAQFGLTYRDAANSILTNGATDFGIFGVLVYPLMIVALLRLMIGILNRMLPPLPVTFIALGTIFELVQTENSVSSYFSTIRNVIIFGVILLIFARLPQIRLSSR